MFIVAWKGRGLNIFIFTVGAFFLPLLAAGVFGKKDLMGWALLLGIVLAVASAWLCAFTICKPSQRTLLDPATGQTVVLTQTHTLYGIPALGCAWTVSALAAIAFAGVLYFLWATSAGHAISAYPKGGAILTAAEKGFSSADGKATHGSNAASEDLAAQLSSEVLAKGIGKPPTWSTPRFYCDLDTSHCAVVVDLPGPPPATDGQKDQIISQAWLSTMALLKKLPQQPPILAVVLHTDAYRRVMIGQLRGSGSSASYNIHANQGADFVPRTFTSFIESGGRD